MSSLVGLAAVAILLAAGMARSAPSNMLDGNLQVVDLSDLRTALPLNATSSRQILWQDQDWEHDSYYNDQWPLGGADTVGFPTVVKNNHGLNQDNKYYLYYAHHDEMSGIGCAVANTITSSFVKISPTDSKVLTVPEYAPTGDPDWQPDPKNPAHYSTPSVVWNQNTGLWNMYFHYYNQSHSEWDADPSRPGQGYQMTALATCPDLAENKWTIRTNASLSGVSSYSIDPVLTTTEASWSNQASNYSAFQRLPYAMANGHEWLAFVRGTHVDVESNTERTELGFATSADGVTWTHMNENPVIAIGKEWTESTNEYRPKFIGYLGENEAGVHEYLVAWAEGTSTAQIIYSTTTDFKTFVRDPRGYATWGFADGITNVRREGDMLYMFAGKYEYTMDLSQAIPEPGTLSLLAIGLSMLLLSRWARNALRGRIA